MRAIRNFLRELSYLQALGLLLLGIFLGAVAAWMIVEAKDKPQIVGVILSAVASFAAAGVALWVALAAWKKETIRETHQMMQKTRFVVSFLQPTIHDLYSAFDSMDIYHKAYIRDSDDKPFNHIIMRESFKSLVFGGIQMKNALKSNALAILGSRGEVCFEVDPTVGIGLMNLKVIAELTLPFLEEIFPEDVDPTKHAGFPETVSSQKLISIAKRFSLESPDRGFADFLDSLLVNNCKDFDEWYSNKNNITDTLKNSGVNFKEHPQSV